MKPKEAMTCPICSHDVPNGPTGKPRVYCSSLCHNRGNSALIVARNSSLDEMAVVRLLEGWVVTSTRSERIEAVRVLSLQGRSAAWIADYLRTTRRSIERYRHEIQTRKAA